jgi:hypothetical protein
MIEGAAMSARQVLISSARTGDESSFEPLLESLVHGPDPVSTEWDRISKRAADPVDRVNNREPMELRRTLPSSLSLPKQQ